MSIGKTNAGGRTSLNFKVVGGVTQPSDPSENMIWVNTPEKITSWIFSATEPVEPVEGMVWFKTGTVSSVEFNALKKNGIQVYPISAKQYVGGAWVDVTAQSYQGGEWISLITYLYNNGDECTKITGGWGIKKQTNSANTTVDEKENAVDISISNATSGHVFYGTEDIVDLSKYNTLYVDCGYCGGTTSYIKVMPRDTTWDLASPSAVYANTVNGSTVALDISALTGSYYIAILASVDSTHTWTQVQMLSVYMK